VSVSRFLGVMVGVLVVAGIGAAAPKFDLAQPQSPALPAPGGLNLVDLGTQDPRLKGYRAPEGIKVEIVAEEPAVVNPVGMTFADDGTPYVLEWRPSPGDEWREAVETWTFKDGTVRKVATLKKRVKDVVKVLRGTKGKGKWDASEVVLEEELPSSILLHDGWLYVSGRGSVRRYRQSKPGGPWDTKEEIARGFAGYGRHQVSGLTIGPDGWLYITAGDDDNDVEGSDGSRAAVRRSGAVFRCKPDGSRLETFALGFQNPYRDVVFDSAGCMFHVDGDTEDAGKFAGCRLMHVAEGNDFGWRLRAGTHCGEPDLLRGAVFGERPGKVPPLLKTGRGNPAGLFIYGETCLPEEYRGLIFYPDMSRRLIRASRVEPQGGSFRAVEEFELLKSDDPLFRPCQMVVGPDGAIYVVDWRTDSSGVGRLWGDGVHGRIYRISWGGTGDKAALLLRLPQTWATIATETDEKLLGLLASEDSSIRVRAQRELMRRGETNRPALLKLLNDDNQTLPTRAAVLGVLYGCWNAEAQKAATLALALGEADMRRLAAEAIGRNATPGDPATHNLLLKALTDDDPAVRRSVALAMARIDAPGAAEALVNTLSFDDGKDISLRDGLIRAIEKTGKAGIERLIALCDSGSDKELERAVEAFTALRTRTGAQALPDVLKNPHLGADQRAAVLRSYGNYLLDPPVSVEPALSYLLANPREAVVVKRAGLEVLAGTDALRSERGGMLLLGLLKDTDPGLRLVVLQNIEETRLVKAGPDLGRIVGDPARSFAERTAAARALRAVGEKAAAPALKGLFGEKGEPSPERTVLLVEGLRTLAALDAAGGAEAARKLLDGSEPRLQAEAALVLGASPAGARELGERYRDGKLPRSLLAQVAGALRRHAGKDPELAKLRAAVIESGLRAPEESQRGLALEYHVVGPYDANPKAVYPPEEKPDLTARYSGEKPGAERAWQTVQTDPAGSLDLRPIFNRESATVYAMTWVWSPREQKAVLLLDSDAILRVWVNDRRVHERVSPRSARPDEDRVEVTLAEGWNKVFLKATGEAGNPGLSLRVTGDRLRLAGKPEGKRP
jgi:putative membrane-bound dehydrogenase-like protein